jgi:hypothetical protein
MPKKDTRPFRTHVAFHRKDEHGNVVESVTLGPDEDRPDWVHEQLAEGTMDHLFAGGPEQPKLEQTDPGNGGQVPPPENASPAGQKVDPHSGQPLTGGQQPPKCGPGSGREAWAAYAATMGVTVDQDASREDIFDALAARGITVE